MSAYQCARITNRGGANAIVQLVPTLAPGSSMVTPKHPSPASIIDLRVRDVGASPVVLEVEERAYQLERTLGLDVPELPTFEATLKRGGDFSDEVFGVYLVSMGSNCGDDLDVVLTPPGGTAGGPGVEPMLVPGASVALAPAQPSPFRTGTTLAHELERTGPATASVHEGQGRRVRRLLDREIRKPGRHRL